MATVGGAMSGERQKDLPAITLAAAITLHGGARKFARALRVALAPASCLCSAFFGIGFLPDWITAAGIRAETRFAPGARLAVRLQIKFCQRLRCAAQAAFLRVAHIDFF
jgi:hypothetical protein